MENLKKIINGKKYSEEFLKQLYPLSINFLKKLIPVMSNGRPPIQIKPKPNGKIFHQFNLHTPHGKSPQVNGKQINQRSAQISAAGIPASKP